MPPSLLDKTINYDEIKYLDPDDKESYTSDCDDIDEDVLQQNDWSMDDTIYGIDTGCELECISGDD